MEKKLGRKPRELTAEERSTVYISLIRGATIREASLTIGISDVLKRRVTAMGSRNRLPQIRIGTETRLKRNSLLISNPKPSLHKI